MKEQIRTTASVYLAEVNIQKSRRSVPLLWLTELCALLLYGFGLLLTLRDGLLLPVNWELFLAVLLLGGAAVLRFRMKRYGWILGLGLFAAVLAAVFFVQELLWTGLLIFRNGVIQAVNAYYFTRIPLESIEITPGGLRAATDLIYLLLLLVFIWIGGYAVVRGRSGIALLLLETPFLWAAVNLGKVPHWLPLTLFLLAECMVFAMHAAQRQPRRRDPEGGFAVKRRKKSVLRQVTASPLHWEGIAKNGRGMLVCAAALLVTIAAAFPRESFVRPPLLQEFNSDPFGFFQKLQSGGLAGGIVSGGIGGGNLGRADQIVFSGEVAFTIQGEIDREQPLYLRGYTGSVYDGSGWEPLPPAKYQGRPEYGFDRWNPLLLPPELTNWMNTTVSAGDWQEQEVLRITGVNLEPEILLLPYGTMESSGGRYLQDNCLRGTENELLLMGYFQSWFSNAWDGRLPPDLNLAETAAGYSARMNEAYIGSFESYAAFVREEYLRLPDTWQAENAFGLPDFSGESLSELIGQIKGYLAATTEYSLSPGRTPVGRDVAGYFLTESKKGYCSHYATAATLILRRAGVPARYVEGYMLPPGLLQQEGRVVQATDERAHAWTEVYVAPFGWIPVDVTPAAGGTVLLPPEESAEEAASSAPESAESAEEAASSAPESAESAEEAASSAPESVESAEEAASSAPESAESAEEAASSAPESSGLPLWAILLTAGLLLLLMIPAVLYLRRRTLLAGRLRRFHQEDRSRAAIEVYGYILRLLAVSKLVPAEAEAPADFARRLAQSGAAPGLERLTALAEKAKYSPAILPAEELAEMTVFAKKLRQEVFAKAGRFKRLWMQWIWVL